MSDEVGMFYGRDDALDRALAVTVPFGEFRGHTLEWLRQHQPSYLVWLGTREIIKLEFRAALRTVLAHYGEAIRRSDEQQRVIDRWKLQ